MEPLFWGKRTGLTCLCHEGSSGGGGGNIIDRIQYRSMNRPSRWRTVAYTHNLQWIDVRSPSTEDAYPQPASGTNSHQPEFNLPSASTQVLVTLYRSSLPCCTEGKELPLPADRQLARYLSPNVPGYLRACSPASCVHVWS